MKALRALTDKVKDKLDRHKERKTALGFRALLSDSIDFIPSEHWDAVAEGASVFLGRPYLRAIEAHSPENTCQRYAVGYADGKPAVILACQVAGIGGERLLPSGNGKTQALAANYKERVLVCGNLVTSGLHGIAFADGIDKGQGWRMAAEMLYRIRRAEKLSGEVDFVLLKDIKGGKLKDSEVVERYSYRRIKTDPDMVLELDKKIGSWKEYLEALNTKYRSKVRKVIKTLEEGGFATETVRVDGAMDRTLHGLYMEVEKRSATRMATLPKGYFKGLADALGEGFACKVLRKDGEVAGFMSVIRDGDEAIAYYTGFRYDLNDKYPLYFRLLQTVIEQALEWGCRKVSFGRTALEPKAGLGAKPVECHVWVRHRVPMVNWAIRKWFRNVPFEEAPDRSVFKDAPAG